MKNKLRIQVVLMLLLSMQMTFNTLKAQSTSVVDKVEIKKEIQAKENEFAAVYNAGELRKIGYYAKDAVSFVPNQAPIVGREAIVEYLKYDVETNTNTISFTTKEVFVSNDGNLVTEVGYYQVADSSNTPINTGNYICLFEKRDGRYYCIRDMSASDRPVEELE